MTAQTTQPASLPWLEKLIAIPTISGNSNLELIELLETEFARYGYSGRAHLQRGRHPRQPAGHRPCR